MTVALVQRLPRRLLGPTPERSGSPWRRSAVLLLVPVVGLSLLLGFFVNGFLMAVPPLAVLIAWALITLPFQLVAPAVAGVMLTFNPPADRPADGNWSTPLDRVGALLYNNLPIKLAFADLIILLLVIRAAVIVALGDGVRGSGTRKPPRPFAQACVAVIVAVFAMSFYGLARGGDFRQVLWQIRVPTLLACLALAASVAATPAGIRRFRNAVLFAGLVKVTLGAYFYFMILPGLPNRGEVLYVTIHADSVLWSSGLAMLIAEWFELRTIGSRRRLIAFGIPLLFGMIINNRRTVWVAVGASVLFIAAVATPHVKRQLARLVAVGWPVIFAYVIVGLAVGGTSPIFKPVSMTESVLFQTDASSSSRDVENLNLLYTNKLSRGIGSGFGHEYIELVPSVNLSDIFEQYKFIPHNSFLGLWAFMGIAGASAYFLLPTLGIFYATWARRRSTVAWVRATAAWSVCIVIAWLIQAWSDVGIQDWPTMVCCGFALGIGASLSRQVAEQGELSGDFPDAALLAVGTSPSHMPWSSSPNDAKGSPRPA